MEEEARQKHEAPITTDEFFILYDRQKRFNEHLQKFNDAAAHFLQEVGQLETIKHYKAMNAKNNTETTGTQTMMKQVAALQPGRLMYVSLTSEATINGQLQTFVIEHTAFHITRKDKSLADIYGKAADVSNVFYKSFEAIFNSIVDIEDTKIRFGEKFVRDLFTNLTLNVYPITADDYNEMHDRYINQALKVEPFIPYVYKVGNPLKQYQPTDAAQLQAIMLLGQFIG